MSNELKKEIVIPDAVAPVMYEYTVIKGVTLMISGGAAEDRAKVRAAVKRAAADMAEKEMRHFRQGAGTLRRL